VTERKIAVIGGGVSGLTAGYVLSRTDHVTLFEADGRLGGHADTHVVGQVPVGTGFIVYNERTYPLLTRLFAELGVTTRAAEMSMSVRCRGCGLHYAGQRGLGGLTAGLNRGGARFARMLAEIPRFHRAARRLLVRGAPDDLTLGGFLDATQGSGPRGTAGSATASRARRGLHRDPERPGRRRPGARDRPDGIRPSGVHTRLGSCSAPPA
jgi:uncharacterized protein